MEKLKIFLNQDKYISYNEYKDFCEKNSLQINE